MVLESDPVSLVRSGMESSLCECGLDVLVVKVCLVVRLVFVGDVGDDFGCSRVGVRLGLLFVVIVVAC